MYDDYMVSNRKLRRGFDPMSERLQAEAARGVNFRQYLGSPDAPVVCVRGNHDRADLSLLFAGCNLAHEFVDDVASVEVCGELLVVAGHRGVPYINGMFSDEESRADLLDRVRRMPAADLYLTHYPPAGLGLDGLDSAHYGLEGMAGILTYRGGHQLHCFGHVHECGGRDAKGGDTTFSNAACTFNVFEGSPKAGWVRAAP